MTDLNIYLDYNAAAPLYPAAYEKMMDVLKHFGNPSSVHQKGRHLSAILENARHEIAHTLGANPSGLIFTSTGSEANNHVLRGFESLGYRILVCATDHISTLAAANMSEVIPVDHQGILNLEILETLLQQKTFDPRPALVSVHLANNESGIIQPLEKIIDCTRRYGAKIHTDAVQAVGRMPLNFRLLGVDAMTFSSGKIGGPFGAAAILLADRITLPALIRGGGQEKGYRAGTHNVAAIAGFNVALQAACQQDWSSIKQLRDSFENTIAQHIPAIEIYGRDQSRLPNTSLIRMPGVSAEVQLMSFDLAVVCKEQKINFAVSAGSACSSGKTTISPVLKAMGVTQTAAQETVRVSLCHTTTADHINLFVQRWLEIFDYHQQRKIA